MNTETCFKKKLYICMKEKIIVHFQKQPSEVFCKKKDKKIFLKISQISQKNTCVEVSL